jgi:hypothetical protein
MGRRAGEQPFPNGERSWIPASRVRDFRRAGISILAKRKNLPVYDRTVDRGRTKNVPGDLTGARGDAALANWVWLPSYTFRAGGHKRGASQLRQAARRV